MTQRKLGKDFRKIVVNDHAYKWRFNGIIVVRDLDNNSHQLTIDFGWFDVWLFANDPLNRPKDYSLKQITPSFVKDAILFALKNGWSTEYCKTLAIKYDAEQFSIPSKTSSASE